MECSTSLLERWTRRALPFPITMAGYWPTIPNRCNYSVHIAPRPTLGEQAFGRVERALAGDDLGNVFGMTGNGKFDGSDFGFSFVKVALSGGSLDLVDWFTPYNWNVLLPDQDLGSGGPMLLPDQPGPYPHLIVGAGKGG